MFTSRRSAVAAALLITSTAGVVGLANAQEAPASSTSTTPTSGGSSSSGPWLIYGRDTLYLSRADGSDEHPLVTAPVQENAGMVHADWSPDGTQVAFEVLADDASVWTVNADGTSPQRRVTCLESPCLQMSEPAWSPDGRRLLVVQYDEGPDGTWGSSWLVVVDLSTGARRTIARTGDESAFYFPRWSPNGRHVVVEIAHFTDSSQSDAMGTVIGVVRADREGPQRVRVLTRPGQLANHPDWHPTKDLLVFSTNDPILFPASTQPSNVFVMRPDGTGRRQLSDQSTDGRLRLGQTTWAPDGRSVVVTVAEASTNGGVVETKRPGFLSLRDGSLRVLANRGADPRLQP